MFSFFISLQEAKEYRTLESDLSLFGELVSDCSAAANHSPGVDVVACRTDLIDLTALYCMRKETAYHHILCQVVHYLLTGNNYFFKESSSLASILSS